MSLIEKLKQIEHLDFLIKRKSTGTPKVLSSKLRISERQVYNIINTMKEMGAPIYFCNVNQCYCYEENVTFKFGFIVEGKVDLNSIRGGGRFDFYDQSFHTRRQVTNDLSMTRPPCSPNPFVR
jgi:hypothetical protein